MAFTCENFERPPRITIIFIRTLSQYLSKIIIPAVILLPPDEFCLYTYLLHILSYFTISRSLLFYRGSLIDHCTGGRKTISSRSLNIMRHGCLTYCGFPMVFSSLLIHTVPTSTGGSIYWKSYMHLSTISRASTSAITYFRRFYGLPWSFQISQTPRIFLLFELYHLHQTYADPSCHQHDACCYYAP